MILEFKDDVMTRSNPSWRTRPGVIVDCPGVWTQKIALLWSFWRGEEKFLLHMTYNPKVLLTIKPRLGQKIFQFCMHSVFDLPDHNIPPTIQAHRWSNIDHLKLTIWSSYNILGEHYDDHLDLRTNYLGSHCLIKKTTFKNTQERLLT